MSEFLKGGEQNDGNINTLSPLDLKAGTDTMQANTESRINSINAGRQDPSTLDDELTRELNALNSPTVWLNSSQEGWKDARLGPDPFGAIPDPRKDKTYPKG